MKLRRVRTTEGLQLQAATSGEAWQPTGERSGPGTLPGGSDMETGHWIKPKDNLELTIDDIGSIEHAIIGS